MAKCKVTHDEDALIDLIEQHEYIARDNPSEADKYIQGLLDTAERASQSPTSGRSEPWIANLLGTPPKNTRSLLYKNHRCYYLIRGDEIAAAEIYVLSYLHGKRKRDNALRKRLDGLRNRR